MPQKNQFRAAGGNGVYSKEKLSYSDAVKHANLLRAWGVCDLASDVPALNINYCYIDDDRSGEETHFTVSTLALSTDRNDWGNENDLYKNFKTPTAATIKLHELVRNGFCTPLAPSAILDSLEMASATQAKVSGAKGKKLAETTTSTKNETGRANSAR